MVRTRLVRKEKKSRARMEVVLNFSIRGSLLLLVGWHFFSSPSLSFFVSPSSHRRRLFFFDLSTMVSGSFEFPIYSIDTGLQSSSILAHPPDTCYASLLPPPSSSYSFTTRIFSSTRPPLEGRAVEDSRKVANASSIQRGGNSLTEDIS